VSGHDTLHEGNLKEEEIYEVVNYVNRKKQEREQRSNLGKANSLTQIEHYPRQKQEQPYSELYRQKAILNSRMHKFKSMVQSRNSLQASPQAAGANSVASSLERQSLFELIGRCN